MAVATTVGDKGRITPQGSRSAGVLYPELLQTDTRQVPPVLKLESPIEPGVTRVPVERYFSKEFHDLVVEKLWKRVWQMACREEDIPGVGDYTVYEIALSPSLWCARGWTRSRRSTTPASIAVASCRRWTASGRPSSAAPSMAGRGRSMAG